MGDHAKKRRGRAKGTETVTCQNCGNHVTVTPAAARSVVGRLNAAMRKTFKGGRPRAAAA